MTTPRVVIVGSGVAGAAVAQGLLERRAASRVTILEAGPPLTMGDERRWLDFLTTGKRPYDAMMDAEDDFTSGPVTLGLVKARLFARGGSTNAWDGFCLRFKPEDFALKSATGHGADWPFGYTEIEPYYHEAETFLGVAGDSSNDDPSRYGKPYPYPAAPHTLADEPIAEMLDAFGYSRAHVPIARYGDRCVTTGTCDYCPVGGRYIGSMSIDELEADYGPDRFRLLMRSPARRIRMRDRRKASGVEYVDGQSGETRLVEAEVVIVCAGAIESPKLLLASADRLWPEGIGNDSGHVGGHLVSHAFIWAEGTLPSNPQRIQQELDFPTLGSRHFDTPEEQPAGKLYFFAARRKPNLKIEELIQHGETLEDIDRRVQGRVRFAIHGFVEAFESPGNRVALAKGKTRFGLPRTAITYHEHEVTAHAKQRHQAMFEGILDQLGCESIRSGAPVQRADHAVATCRMSATSGDGVVDANLRVHGTDNLYVCSNATFPNVTAVNPTLTLTALAIRLGRSLGK